MKIKRSLAFAVLATLLALPGALAQSPPVDDPEALRRLKLYADDLIATLSESEQRIARRVVLRATPGGGFSGVGADVMPDGKPFINVNQGTHYAVQQIAQAIVLAVHVIKQDSFLFGYVRTVAYWSQFGQPITAVQFAEHYGVTDAQAKLDALDDAQRAIGDHSEAVMMLFITAHEFAHHINGDVGNGILPPEEQRPREALADAWAARRVMALGLSPEMAAMSMQALNEIERAAPPGGSLMRRHPEALQRAEALMSSVLANLDTNSVYIRAVLAGNPEGPSFEKYSQSLRKINQLIKDQAQTQRLLDTDPKVLQDSAKKGDIRSQFRLSELHLTGQMPGVPKSKKLARLWAEQAALNDAPYEYFDSAYAAYFAGKLVFNDGGEDHRACYYIRRGASMNLIAAVHQLAKFNKDKICKD